jgi:hypothetical protein
MAIMEEECYEKYRIGTVKVPKSYSDRFLLLGGNKAKHQQIGGKKPILLRLA